MSHDSLGDRQKDYEKASRRYFPRRLPLMIRLDGSSFKTFTRGMIKPFDIKLIDAMNTVAIKLCSKISGAQLAYLQSDEITILVHNYKKLESQPWFDNCQEKIESISAGMASSFLTQIYNKDVFFDSRAWVMPESDVNNNFLWRQQDTIRNSVQMVAQSLFSQKELNRKNIDQLKNLILTKGQDWSKLDTSLQRGRCIVKKQEVQLNGSIRNKWVVDSEIPIFSDDPAYIEKYLRVDNEKMV